jgi:hypothetical protein
LLRRLENFSIEKEKRSRCLKMKISMLVVGEEADKTFMVTLILPVLGETRSSARVRRE